MNAIAALYADEALRLANERANRYRREADQERLAATGRSDRGRFGGVRAAIASFRETVTAVEPGGLVLPPLNDYPYRG